MFAGGKVVEIIDGSGSGYGYGSGDGDGDGYGDGYECLRGAKWSK